MGLNRARGTRIAGYARAVHHRSGPLHSRHRLPLLQRLHRREALGDRRHAGDTRAPKERRRQLLSDQQVGPLRPPFRGDRRRRPARRSYWYHFAIMFEAVFILTTIDSGVRIGRFVLQEYGGRVWKPFGRSDSIAASLTSTVAIAFAICYFIWTGSINTVWPMFGVANQLLAVVGLAVATTLVINIGRQKYAWITFVPLCFLAISTLSAGYLNIRDNYWPMAIGADSALVTQGYVNTICTAIMMLCAVVILVATTNRSVAVLTGRIPALSLAEAEV